MISFERETRRGAAQGWQQRTGDSKTITGRLVEIAVAGFTVLNVALPAPEADEQFAA